MTPEDEARAARPKSVSKATGITVSVRVDEQGRMLCGCVLCNNTELMVETDEPGVFGCRYYLNLLDEAAVALGRVFAEFSDEELLGNPTHRAT